MKIKAKRIFDGTKFTQGTVHIDKGIISNITHDSARGADFVMPGFIDSHVHLLSVGLALQALRLNNCTSKEHFSAELASYAQSFTGQWIVGRGWDQNKMGFTPDRHYLDSICPNRPVVLNRTCGHVLAANTKALEASGVSETTTVAGGVVKRDSHGKLTGILEEKAMQLVHNAVPRPEPAILYSALERAIKYAYDCGITGVQTDDRGVVGSYDKLWDLYTSVTSNLPLRAQLHYNIGSKADLLEYIYLRKQIQDTEFIYKGAAKLFLDGSLGARTAALVDDYSDDMGNRGVLIYPDEEVEEIVRVAEQEGVQLAMHAIGDRAIEQAITAVTKVKGGNATTLAHRIIHCQITNSSQIQRMVALGLVAEIQPVFLQTDMHWAKSRVGEVRLQTSYAWQTMERAGLVMTGGSDAPVEDINPWPGVYTAVTRKDQQGHYAIDWQQDESLSLEKALEIYTKGSAWLAKWDFGCIRPGMKADVAVYEDFDTELLDNKPSSLYINGVKMR